jgi:CRISPR associated protein Cas1
MIVNALLNYGYALAEAECRIAILAVGLDPGLGIVHTDHRGRDSLALDLQEPLRPVVDQHVLDLLKDRHFRADDFHETRSGECRLLPPLTHELAGWMPELARAVATIAEKVAHAIARSSPNKIELRTPLTRAKTRAAQNRSTVARQAPLTPTPLPTCRSSGAQLYEKRRKLCSTCWGVTRKELATQRAATAVRALAAARASGTDPTQSSEAQEKRRRSLVATKRAEAAWRSSREKPTITQQQLHEEVIPRLKERSLREVQETTGLSPSACSRIRSGKLTPHPRHWANLALLAHGRGHSASQRVTG